MKSVWILQTGEPVPGDPGNPRKLRAFNLAEKLANEGISVTIWTSLFDHTKKLHRESSEGYRFNEFIDVKFLKSPGYKNNISISRLYDHLILAKNFKRATKNTPNKPDLLFIGFPPIELAYIAIKWAKKNSIYTILDYKDLWPEIFLNILSGRFQHILKFFLYPFFYMSRFTLSQVDALISISEPFLNKALLVSGRKRTNKDTVIPLTTNNENKRTNEGKSDFDLILQSISFDKDKDHLLSFAGTFMVDVFDFNILKETINELSKRGISLKVILCGEGQEKNFWEQKFLNQKEIFFAGWVNQEILSRVQEQSLAILIPLKDREDFSLSIPNKAIDALSKGKIILTGTDSYLSQSLLANQAGFKYTDYMSLSDIIEGLVLDKNRKLIFESNALEFYIDKFEFNKTYQKLINLIFLLFEKNAKRKR